MGRETNAAMATASHSNAKSFKRSMSVFNTAGGRGNDKTMTVELFYDGWGSKVKLRLPALSTKHIPMIIPWFANLNDVQFGVEDRLERGRNKQTKEKDIYVV